ncbi:hypothetical protein V2J09_015506 [Rumex salicifolius]
MERRYSRKSSVEEDSEPRFDAEDDSSKHQSSFHAESEDQEPFMGVKVRRKASLFREFRGDYLNLPSQPYLMNIIKRQGDTVYFADKVLKFTNSGKIKRRILIITDSAVYIIDPETNALKRRITLAAVEMICLSKLSDNFFAVIIPTEYDLLMASMRKTEIVTALVDATKSTSNYELDVQISNRFVYHATADMQKEVSFEEAEVSQPDTRCNFAVARNLTLLGC